MGDYDDLVGKITPRAFAPEFVVLSYVVSYVGALTTVELLQRRTSRRGWYNWNLLIASSVSMGGVAIWCMHFIANCAIVLGNKEPDLQIVYNATFTAISFFVPIVVLLAAFMLIGANETVSFVRLVPGGALAGLAICGMHYLGQAGIANYSSVYDSGRVVGAAIIAVVASITALSLFFVFQASWTTSWWKRALCAAVLAGAVSGMHWTASSGTNYRFRKQNVSVKRPLTRSQTVVIVLVFSFVSCSLLIGLAIVARRRRAAQANRAQQVVLACATFDHQGRLMVTPEGNLPNQKITDSYIGQSFDEVFSPAHPVFQWIYRTTRNWSAVANLIHGMRRHIGVIDVPKMTDTDTHYDPLKGDIRARASEDYSIVFRELFCIAAEDLARQINGPLEKLGALYDDILRTGQTRKKRIELTKNRYAGFPNDFGHGQLLFVFRVADKMESSRLQALGYRFADIPHVIDILAEGMRVNREELIMHIESMRDHSSGDKMLQSGIHLSCFAVRASVKGGFDILVQKAARNLLPTIQLPIAAMDQTYVGLIKGLDGMSVESIMKQLRDKRTMSSSKEHLFTTSFYNTLVALADEIVDPLFLEAILVGKPLRAPGQATLIAFVMIEPIQSNVQNPRLQFVSLELFRCQQHVYKGAPGHGILARKIHREFSGVGRMKRSAGDARRNSQTIQPLEGLRRFSRPSLFGLENNSQKSLVESLEFGGIMVSQEVNVSVDASDWDKGDVELVSRELGTSGQVVKEDGDVETFVEQLMACIPRSNSKP